MKKILTVLLSPVIALSSLINAPLARANSSFPTLKMSPTLNSEAEMKSYESETFKKLLSNRSAQCSDFMKFVEGKAEGALDKKGEVLAKDFDTYGILVARQNGEVLLEKYYKGAERKTKFKIFSVSKMFTVLSYGNLEYEGLLGRKNLVKDFLHSKVQPTEAKNYKYWDDLNIEHLLTMSSGIPWCEYTNCMGRDTVMMMFNGKQDVTSYYFSNATKFEKQTTAPGAKYTYSAGNSVIIQSIMKQKLGHENYVKYPFDRIMSKLGVAADDFAFEMDGKGVFMGGSGMFMTLPAFSKLGMTLLNGGGYGNNRIAESEFVRQMTTEVIAPLKAASEHTRAWEGPTGMGLWLNTDKDEDGDGKADLPSFMPDVPRNMFYSSGLQGKRLMVFPEDGNGNGFIVARIGVENNHSTYWQQYSKKAYQCFGKYIKGEINPKGQQGQMAATEPPKLSSDAENAEAAGTFINTNIPVQLVATELCNCIYVSNFGVSSEGKLDKDKTIERCNRLVKADLGSVPSPYKPESIANNIAIDEAAKKVSVTLHTLAGVKYTAGAQLVDHGYGNKTCQITQHPGKTWTPASLIKFIKLNILN